MLDKLTGNPIIDYGFLILLIYLCICSFYQLYNIFRKIRRNRNGKS